MGRGLYIAQEKISVPFRLRKFLREFSRQTLLCRKEVTDMIRKLTALLLALCLIPVLSLAAVSEEALAKGRELAVSMAEEAIASLKDESEGLTASLLDGAEIAGTEDTKNGVKVIVTVPDRTNRVKSSEKIGEDVWDYLRRCFAGYTDETARKEIPLTVTVSEKNGEVTAKWGSNGKSKLKSELKTLANNVKKSYGGKNLKEALGQAMLPKCVEWPKKKPDSVPEASSLAEYTARFAEPLGLTPEQCEARLPALLLLVKITAVEIKDSPESANLTVRVEDWDKMLERCLTEAKAALDQMNGVPEMSAERLEEIFCDQLLYSAMLVHYRKTVTYNDQQWTENLVTAVTEGPQTMNGLTELMKLYSANVDKALQQLREYAAGEPMYVRAEEIPSTILTGSDDGTGTPVVLTGGSEKDIYVALFRADGSPVLTGYAQKGCRLSLRLNPGSYRVLWTSGAMWYGEDTLFGPEEACGSFEAEISGDDRIVITLRESEEGTIGVTAMTWEQLKQEADPARKLDKVEVYIPNVL